MEEEILLGEIFSTLKKKMGQILICSFLGLLVSGVFTFFFVTPTYQSTSKIVVNQIQNTSQTITSADIQTNLSLISTYQSIIQEPIILETVIDVTASKLTPAELRDKITINTDDDSLVFGVTISDENPYIAAELANAIATTFQQKIGDILEVESVTILSTAIANTKPVSPNTLMNLFLGLFAGLIIGIVSAFLSEMTNKSVKDEKFIESLGWSNLGSVLEMTPEEIKETRISQAPSIIKPNIKRLSRRRV